MSPHAAFTNGSPPHSLEMFWWHILFCRFKRTLSSWVQITGIAHNPITCNLLPLPNSTDYVLPPPGGRAKMHPLSSLYSVLLLHKMIAHPSTQIKFVCPIWMSVRIGIPMNVPLSCSWGWRDDWLLGRASSQIFEPPSPWSKNHKISVAGGKWVFAVTADWFSTPFR